MRCMSAKTARREYLQAVADFERGVRDFARGMGALMETAAAKAPGETLPDDALPLLASLGPRKPARRAPRTDAAPDAEIKREAGFGR